MIKRFLGHFFILITGITVATYAFATCAYINEDIIPNVTDTFDSARWVCLTAVLGLSVFGSLVGTGLIMYVWNIYCDKLDLLNTEGWLVYRDQDNIGNPGYWFLFRGKNPPTEYYHYIPLKSLLRKQKD